MKNLLYIILLLPLWVNAQTNGTIQKTSATGTIRGSFGSLGLDTLVNVNAPTNGFVPVYNSTLKKSVWTNPSTFSPTISFGTFGSTPNAQGGSYSGGVITLQPADATNPGGVSTTTQTIKGNKTIINDADTKNTLLTLRNNVNGNGASSAIKIESNGDNYLEFNVNSSIWDGGAYGGQTYMQANGGVLNISATLSGSNVPVKITKPSVLATNNINWTTLASLATSERTATFPDASGTVLFDNGNGSGLSGVVLTSTDQTIAGVKTFSGSLAIFNNSILSGGLGITGSGAKPVVFESIDNGTSLSIRRFNNTFSAIQNYMTGSTGMWDIGLRPSSDNYTIRNLSTLSNALTIALSDNSISALGSISSTPQGTLYGTATGSITSAQLATSLTDETGTGSAVFATSPTLVTPNIGNATGGTLGLSGALIGTSATFSGQFNVGGRIVSTQGNNTKFFESVSATTGFTYLDVKNTSGQFWLGLESSIGGTLLSGASAYSTVLSAMTSTSLHFGTNSAVRYTIDASGNNTWTGSGSFGSTGVAGKIDFRRSSDGNIGGSIDLATNAMTISASGGANPSITLNAGNIYAPGFFKASNDGTYVSSSGSYHELLSSADGQNILLLTSNASTTPYGILMDLNTATNNAASYFFYGRDGGTQRFTVYTNGGISNYSANNVNLSDERAKKSIVKAGSYWNIIKSIEFDNYKYKDQIDNRTLLGVMAQQVESIYPEWVSNSGSFGKASDGTNLKSVYEQQLQYGVNIVVQESMKRIEALEAEIAILKSK